VLLIETVEVLRISHAMITGFYRFSSFCHHGRLDILNKSYIK